MATSATSGSEARKGQVRQSQQAINGIDYLELLPAPNDPGAFLLVYLLKAAGVANIGPALVSIAGGARLTTIPVQWTAPASALLPVGGNAPPGSPSGWTTPLARALSDYLEARGQYDPANPGASAVPARVLVVRALARGDLAAYSLALTSPSSVLLDPQLRAVTFSFQVDESEFDFGAAPAAARPSGDEPEIDYQAKDYASFRRLMLDRLSTLLPGWEERNPADLGVTLVELLSAAADQLSYYQDAVATEAYLGTARRRISVRRHARLLDYLIHDGANARAFAALEVGSGAGDAPLTLLPGPGVQVQLLTAVDTLPPAAAEGSFDPALISPAEVFEPLHDVLLRKEHNAIPFYAWGAPEATLPQGATEATLRNKGGQLPDGGLQLSVGDLLLLEEVRGPPNLDEGDARPDRRQVVRLTQVIYTSDPLFDETTGALYGGSAPNPNPLQVVRVAWSDADALGFELNVGSVPGGGGVPLPISVARGNVVLVDHGRTVAPEEPLSIGDVELDPPRLSQGPLTQQGRVRDARGVLVAMDPQAPASHALSWQMRDVQPSIVLTELRQEAGGVISAPEPWSPRKDLLGSDRFASDFVVEMDDEQRAWLRFGDDMEGRRPLPGTTFTARYRVGNGTRGNISAEALRHVLFRSASGAGAVSVPVHTSADKGILRVRNPLAGAGGTEPQSPGEARLLAPTAFRRQERAVTEADYSAIAEQFPGVQKAAAVFRWTGSWHTAFVYVDRDGGAPVDDAFRTRLGQYLERFRMTRHDLQIESPRYVPLDLAFTIHVAEDYLRSTVRKALLEAFSNAVQPGGAKGFFHPERWTFGQPVLLSEIVAAAMAVPGVAWVDFTSPGQRFQRWGTPPQGELAQGLIRIEPLEIARMDNDAGRPENGRLELNMVGGL